jgi:thiamine biosynthesis lipoprotein
MNTDLFTVGLAPAAAAEIFQWLELMEKQFSRFLPDSELSRVNQNAGIETSVSERFIRLLVEALQYHEQTEGIFSPFLGLAMNRAGYRQTFESLHTESISIDDTEAPNQDAGEPMLVDIQRRMVRINPHFLLDFGGFAKGWCVQQIGEKIKGKFPSAG